MNKPQTFNGDLDNLPPALRRLTTEPRWVVWSWELRHDKGGKAAWTKPPRQARSGEFAKSNDPETWGPHHVAVAAVKAGKADGIGFVLKGSGIGAIDLDKCRDPGTGILTSWAEALHTEADSAYHEVTVSGTGTRILGCASGPRRMRRFNLDGGGGIELFRDSERYITISGFERGACAALPPIDDLIDTIEERYDAQPKCADEVAGPFDFNGAAGQAADFNHLVRNGAPNGQRSEAFQAAVWHLAGKGMNEDDIVEELARHPGGIATKYAERLPQEVARSYSKWRSQRRANGTGEAAEGGASWPTIRVVAGELPRIVNEAETALLGLGREIFQRGGMIVRPALTPVRTFHDNEAEAWRIIEASPSYLAESMARAAQWQKHVRREDEWVSIDVPERVVEAYRGRVGDWRLPVLTAITGAPHLRRDGSLHDVPGYDAVTGLLYKPECTFDAIAARPTRDDALAALGEFDELLKGFPFVTPADKAVALSAILTGLDRHNMPTAPLHGFTATTAGTGKSKLADIVSILATGRSCAVKAQPGSEDELEKRLNSELLQGAAIVCIDNCERPLQSAFLCQMLTQRTASIRLLGHSKNIEASTSATVMATGNNLQIVGDLTRRALLCSLDAGVEHPERRLFDWDAAVVAKERRGRLVPAALTILRAWHAAGARGEAGPLGGFEDWSRRIRAPLMWLGCADPCETTLQLKTNDPVVEQLQEVMAAWKECIGPKVPVKVRDIINKGLVAPDLHNALMAVAGTPGRSDVVPRLLGMWLNGINGRIVTGMAIRKANPTREGQAWRLVVV